MSESTAVVETRVPVRRLQRAPILSADEQAAEWTKALGAYDCAARQKRAQRLFAALDQARNKKRVGPLNREDLYDRTVLRRH